MYTTTMIALTVLVSIWFLYYKKRNKINYLYMYSACGLFVFFGWIEFASLNIKDVMPGWVFNIKHVTGIMIGVVPLEDVLFAPVMAVVFFLLYIFTDKYIEHTSTKIGKVSTMTGLFLLTFFFFVFGNYLSQYSAIKMSLGMLGILYAWKEWDLKHFFSFLGVSIVAALVWDLWANMTEQWLYRVDPALSSFQAEMFAKYGKQYSNIFMDYKWNWVKIGNSWLPIEIMPYYYINGPVFIYGMLALLRKVFPKHQ